MPDHIKVTIGGVKHELTVRDSVRLVLVCPGVVSEKIEYPDRLRLGVEETIYHALRVERFHQDTPYWVGYVTLPRMDRRVTKKLSGHEQIVYAAQVRAHGEGVLAGPVAKRTAQWSIGTQHIVGLIDLSLKLADQGVPFAWIQPESLLHPSWAVELGDFFIHIMNIKRF